MAPSADSHDRYDHVFHVLRIIIIIIIIMFVYLIADIPRNTNIRHAGQHYIQKVKPAKLLSHTAHSN